DGVARFAGTSPDGPDTVDVFGRDAWSGQFSAALSRWVTMRGPGAHLAVTWVQQAEHEALMTLVAARHGVAAAPPTLVAKAPNGDVLLVAPAPVAHPLTEATPELAAAAWELLARLH